MANCHRVTRSGRPPFRLANLHVQFIAAYAIVEVDRPVVEHPQTAWRNTSHMDFVGSVRCTTITTTTSPSGPFLPNVIRRLMEVLRTVSSAARRLSLTLTSNLASPLTFKNVDRTRALFRNPCLRIRQRLAPLHRQFGLKAFDQASAASTHFPELLPTIVLAL
jgi:hypothetical protein